MNSFIAAPLKAMVDGLFGLTAMPSWSEARGIAVIARKGAIVY